MNKKHIILLLKILVIIAAFALVIAQVDSVRILQHIMSVNPIYAFAAFVMLMFSQVISALRMRMYFAEDDLEINKKFAVAFYFVGMFLNNLLPGGIGGDGYKVYLIGKLANFSKMRALQITLSERASGLLSLIVLAAIAALFSSAKNLIPYTEFFVSTGIVATVVGYIIALKFILKEKRKTALKALPFSLLVQILGVLCVTFIMFSLGIEISEISKINNYVLLFFISSILSIIPISIGGVGIREVSFMYGSQIIGLNAELGVAIAIIYFIINLLCSANGVFFWYKLEKIYNNK